MRRPKLKGIFFWTKKKEPSMSAKAEEMLKLYIKYIPEIRKIMRNEDSSSIGQLTTGSSNGQVIGQMYDFFEKLEESFSMVQNTWMNPDPSQQKKDDRIEAKPLEVRGELEHVPQPWNVDASDLEEKILLLNDKTLLVNQSHSRNQIEGLITRLQNRKRYAEEAVFFSSFPNTTDEKIDALLAKYKLECKKSDLFVPSFPKEAIDVMKKYSEVTKKITGQSPVYYVIAEQADFVEKRKKLDPILLAQSPFGFYWQILGAWDKEMLLLSEL